MTADELIQHADLYVAKRLASPNRPSASEYLDALQHHAQAIYEGLRSGRYSRNAVITAFAPLAEARAGRDEDAESVGYVALIEAVDQAQDGIENFAAWLTTRIRHAISDHRRKERNWQRFRGDALTDRIIDHRNHVGEVDTRDELDSLATDDIDRAILRLREQRHTDVEIAEMVGLSKSAVHARRQAMEAKLAVVAEDGVDEFITMADNKSDKQIADDLKVSPTTVAARRRTLERRYRDRQRQLHALCT